MPQIAAGSPTLELDVIQLVCEAVDEIIDKATKKNKIALFSFKKSKVYGRFRLPEKATELLNDHGYARHQVAKLLNANLERKLKERGLIEPKFKVIWFSNWVKFNYQHFQ